MLYRVPLYHEAKMLACKGIFAKPSISSPCEARKGRKPRDVYRSDKQPRRYYTIFRAGRQMFLMKQRILRSAAVDLPLSGRLYLHEPVILALLCKKLGGRTALDYLALIHNYNLVCARKG